MTTYDYRCRTCETTFEVPRGVVEAALPVRCPQGHPDVSQVTAAVNAGGLPGRGARMPSQSLDDCCGEGCCG